jgi:predicted dehydrogenase
MREKQHLRTGIIGSGFAASFHFEALEKVHGADVEVIGVYSSTPENRRAFARQRRIEAFGSVDELIDHCDVIHVCTPVSTHEEYAVSILQKDKFAVVEKPLTGFWGDGSGGFRGDLYPKEKALSCALESVNRLKRAEAKSRGKVLYAENWIYAPAVQKEREIIEKTNAQLLWVRGEESHSGSHAKTYGYWKHSGGGVMLGKGCHPLSAALYLKRIEGMHRDGAPIRPASISARIHSITRLDRYDDQHHLRSDYFDVEDCSTMHVAFEDGTIADIFSSDILMGGINNRLDILANNHRVLCNINPNDVMKAYNPVENNFRDIYVVEKIGTKQGWSTPCPDEDFITGYPMEMEAFYRNIVEGTAPESSLELAADVISTIFHGYLSAERNGAEVGLRDIVNHGG